MTQAPAGQPLTLLATITDNIAVTGASAFHRPLGGGGIYTELPMINATGDQYTVNIPAAAMTTPGVEYYLEATDGVSVTREGSPAAPFSVTVVDQPFVATVVPDTGTSAGGEVVTVEGSNFVDPPAVRFGGNPSPAVTFVSSTELQATTPAHFPASVDVEVENPNLTVGRLTHGFTFLGNTATLTLPTTTGDRLTTEILAIHTPSVEGLISAHVTVQFDPAVLTAIGASAGGLTPGFSIAANTSVPGEVTISMAGASPVTGAGDLMLLELEVIGPPAATTALNFVAAELNDGAIPANPVDGQLTVNDAFDVTGAVAYYQDALPVPAVQLDATGSGSFTTATDPAGVYVFSGIPSGTYTLTPMKSDDASPAVISPFDASLVLQHDAGLITLTGHQATAADVNKASGITPFDASLILQYTVGLIGLPFPGNPRVWDFNPSLYSYPFLDQDQSGQDFTAVLAGDPSGNWSAPAAARGPGATLRFADHVAGPSQPITVPLVIEDAGGMLSLLATVAFDPSILLPAAAATTDFSASFSLVSNFDPAGEIVLGMASATPLMGSGELVSLTFDVVGNPAAVSPLDLVSANLDEGAIPVILIDGQVQVDPAFFIFADGFESGDATAWSSSVP